MYHIPFRGWNVISIYRLFKIRKLIETSLSWFFVCGLQTIYLRLATTVYEFVSRWRTATYMETLYDEIRRDWKQRISTHMGKRSVLTKRYRSNKSTKFSLEIFITRQGFVCRTWSKGRIHCRLTYRFLSPKIELRLNGCRLFRATLAKTMKSPRHAHRLMIVRRSRLRR